ncbi:sperm-egg fusion protein TMEM95 [Amia ocellicauda]|uniref:sperm-egg fusion protein TMEM95 n=1 Tax=Amia ocellicauda TaxID=2972642 RepID=UPI003463F644
MRVCALLALALLCGAGGPAAGCVFCGPTETNIRTRVELLCLRYLESHRPQDCSRYSAVRHLQPFALAQARVDQLTEGVDRVLRELESNGSTELLPRYWDWLFEAQLPQFTQEALCPPQCRGVGTAVNCSSCRSERVPCWSYTRCFPGRMSLAQCLQWAVFTGLALILIGLLFCVIE